MPPSQRRLGYRLAIGGLLFICALTLMPAPGEVSRAAATPVYCIICGDVGGVDFSLNVLLFVPFGLGLGLAGLPWRRVLFVGAATTFTVELLQLEVIVGRDASLGDIVSNTLGTGIGALVAAHWRSLLLPSARLARKITAAGVMALCGIWIGTAWAFTPSLSTDGRWFGAWAPELGNYSVFRGTALAVSAGGEPLLEGPANDQVGLQMAVAANPEISFRAVLGQRPRRLAPIGLIVDEWRGNIIFIGQERRDLTFTLRLRADLLRLWSPQVNLHDGMAGQPGDTVEGSGALRNGTFELSSTARGQELSRRLPVSPSWGWSLVTPWPSVLGEEVHFLTGLWIAGLIGVLAYYSMFAGGTARFLPPTTALILLGLIPFATSLPAVHWSEWVAAAIGALTGSAAAARARNPHPTSSDRVQRARGAPA